LLAANAEQIPQPLPAWIRHYPFVPHSRLLPRAAALVHHGGIGTAFQALAAGIPQLIVPVFLDQPDNGRRFTQLGVAATVHPGSYHPREVCHRLDHLLRSAEVAERCREYAGRCRESNAADKACVAIEGLFASASNAQSRSKDFFIAEPLGSIQVPAWEGKAETTNPEECHDHFAQSQPS
jgi:UDP:flavonoid glycosyltransferase YjiC (YdhE family)